MGAPFPGGVSHRRAELFTQYAAESSRHLCVVPSLCSQALPVRAGSAGIKQDHSKIGERISPTSRTSPPLQSLNHQPATDLASRLGSFCRDQPPRTSGMERSDAECSSQKTHPGSDELSGEKGDEGALSVAGSARQARLSRLRPLVVPLQYRCACQRSLPSDGRRYEVQIADRQPGGFAGTRTRILEEQHEDMIAKALRLAPIRRRHERL